MLFVMEKKKRGKYRAFVLQMMLLCKEKTLPYSHSMVPGGFEVMS